MVPPLYAVFVCRWSFNYFASSFIKCLRYTCNIYFYADPLSIMFNVVAQSVLALLEDNRRLRVNLIVSVFFFTEKV